MDEHKDGLQNQIDGYYKDPHTTDGWWWYDRYHRKNNLSRVTIGKFDKKKLFIKHLLQTFPLLLVGWVFLVFSGLDLLFCVAGCVLSLVVCGLSIFNNIKKM